MSVGDKFLLILELFLVAWKLTQFKVLFPFKIKQLYNYIIHFIICNFYLPMYVHLRLASCYFYAFLLQYKNCMWWLYIMYKKIR